MKVNECRKIHYVKNKDKEDGVDILISDKIDFNVKSITKNKDDYFIMIKVPIQEGTTIVDECASINRVLKNVKKKLTEIRRK